MIKSFHRGNIGGVSDFRHFSVFFGMKPLTNPINLICMVVDFQYDHGEEERGGEKK